MKLFKPFSLGNLTLKNKIVMAPMTRSRAYNNVPTDEMATYYEQRAGAGLIITEGTSPSPNGLGYPRIPGAFSKSQIVGWKKIAKKVHDKDGLIFVQLMHCGRVSHKENLPVNEQTIAPSQVQLEGEIYTDTKGLQSFDIPKEMTLQDIRETQNAYVNSANLLVNNANIDGVELHGANGYLINQFLNPISNLRNDIYGGNYKNRARFLLETTMKTVEKIGENRVGVRLSPYTVSNGMLGQHDEVIEMYQYLAQELTKLKIAYIHIADHSVLNNAPKFATDISKTIKENFKGVVIVGGDVDTAKKGETLLDKGYDLVYIGRPFISNPTLVKKLESGIALTTPDYEKFYTPTMEGYIDYK